jgi:hypothetical protein
MKHPEEIPLDLHHFMIQHGPTGVVLNHHFSNNIPIPFGDYIFTIHKHGNIGDTVDLFFWPYVYGGVLNLGVPPKKNPVK